MQFLFFFFRFKKILLHLVYTILIQIKNCSMFVSESTIIAAFFLKNIHSNGIFIFIEYPNELKPILIHTKAEVIIIEILRIMQDIFPA